MKTRYFFPSLIVIGLILTGITIMIHPVTAYEIIGDSVIFENQYAKLEVYPFESKGLITQQQYAQVYWKYPDNQIDIAFRFEFQLNNSNIWLWKNISHDVKIDDYGWFDDGNGSEYIKLGSHIEQRFWFDWYNIKHLFEYTIYNGKHYYYITNVNVKQFETIKVKWQYDVPINTFGKWDLLCKLSSDSLSNIRVNIDPWWNGAWTYHKTLFICDNISNYQMKLIVSKGATYGNVNVSCNSHCNNNFSDIRFIYNNATELYYWMENYTSGDQATFWININDSTEIQMYYGNTNVMTTSDPMTTFIQFDDEDWVTDWTEDATYNTGDFYKATDYVKTGTYSGKMNSTNGNSGWHLTLNGAINYNISIDFWFRTDYDSAGCYQILTDDTSHAAGDQSAIVRYYNSGGNGIEYYDGGSWIDIGDYVTNTWYWMSLRNFNWSGDTFDVYQNDSLLSSCDFRNSKASSSYFEIFANNVNQHNWYDSIRIRLWNDTEPSFCSFGTEQTTACSILTITIVNPVNNSNIGYLNNITIHYVSSLGYQGTYNISMNNGLYWVGTVTNNTNIFIEFIYQLTFRSYIIWSNITDGCTNDKQLFFFNISSSSDPDAWYMGDFTVDNDQFFLVILLTVWCFMLYQYERTKKHMVLYGIFQFFISVPIFSLFFWNAYLSANSLGGLAFNVAIGFVIMFASCFVLALCWWE